MATVIVTIGQVTAYGVFDGDAVRSESITSSATTASGLLAAGRLEYAQVFCSTAVYARSGGPCTAATAIYCPPNFPTYIRMTEGDAVAVLDA